MNRLVLNRYDENDRQTTGKIYVVDDQNRVLFECVSIELPFRNNEKRVSRIPAGTYIIKLRKSKKYGNHLHVTGVPNRTLILIHAGNFYFHTLGCILAGEKFVDINNDGLPDAVSSKRTMKKLMEYITEGTTILIQNMTE